MNNTSLASSRRVWVAALAGWPLAAAASRLEESLGAADWIVGTWQSDAERTMRSFTFQGSRPTGEARERISALFGSMTHTFTRERFMVGDARTGRTSLDTAYRIVGVNSHAVSIAFPKTPGLVDMTLYRDGDFYFIRSAGNLEFFRRVSALPVTGIGK
ncbi:MAG: hypothetical protein EOP70_06615 [Variovorax sp.]|nr:MAG: hypothetical protein EOP70_06615 [Variovorax sp.]